LKIELFYEPKERLRATIEGDRSYLTVKPVWASPLTRPNAYLCLLDGKNEPVAMFADPKQELSDASFQAIQEELRRRDLTARVSAVTGARQEFGATYWSVETDRGPRDFVSQNLSESALWFGENHVLLMDVEGNRFEIVDLEQLDSRSRALVDSIL
jgi:hypothetical protein